MEDVLQQLLDAELQAETLVTDAKSEHDKIIHRAREEARAAEERFEAHRHELRPSFMEKAEERAAQTIMELRRRHEERLRQFQAQAEEREQDTVEAALALLLDPTRD